MIDEEKFGVWMREGIENGWVTVPFCNTHDIDPGMSEEEQEEWENGFDPCQHVLRIMV